MDLALRPDELVAAWRQDTRRLQLAAPDKLAAQQRVAARITLAGRGFATTITGRVMSQTRHADGFRLELAPDDLRVRALERLLAIARGAPAGGPTRAPRFLATLPVVVLGPAGPTYMNTFSVSENGCGLSWCGPVPGIDAPMEVRLGAGSRAASFRGLVCYASSAGRAATVGVRFVAGHRTAWTQMLSDVQRAGAPLA
jgi:hypothetical protein